MEFDTRLRFLDMEQKKITKGDRAGQSFFIIKVLSGADIYELTIFDLSSPIIQKCTELKQYQEFNAHMKLSQGYNKALRLDILKIL